MKEKQDNIVLIGMMGTGKTTVGARLAEETGYPLVDLDALISEKAGCPIPQLFAERGEPYFRDLEAAVLKDVLAQEGIILATGGGAVLREENCREMAARGWVVALKATVEEIVSRVGEDPGRPLLAGGARSRVEALLDQRRQAYDFAHVIIDTSGKSPEEVSAEILTHYRGSSN
ncbi:shikimate kinase [Paenibacillus antibioticophila]|uniref:shikimate kinase n=1 Tax=Paenibacillus antibioticophila TaxID=1274374 RepID=UPI0035B50551